MYPAADSLPQPGGRATPRERPRQVTSFTTTLPSFVDPGLEAFLIGHGVEISAKPIQEERSLLMTILLNFGPGLFFIAFYIWLFRRAGQGGGGLMGIGKSKARRYDQEQSPKVTFEDVAGIEEAENELVEIVDFEGPGDGHAPRRTARRESCWSAPQPGDASRAVAGEAGLLLDELPSSSRCRRAGAARVRIF
jgi:cell division protease FtsH